MKKSDLLLDIATTIVLTSPVEAIPPWDQAQEQAAAILEVILKAGMLPPPDHMEIHTVDEKLAFYGDIGYNNPCKNGTELQFWTAE